MSELVVAENLAAVGPMDVVIVAVEVVGDVAVQVNAAAAAVVEIVAENVFVLKEAFVTVTTVVAIVVVDVVVEVVNAVAVVAVVEEDASFVVAENAE